MISLLSQYSYVCMYTANCITYWDTSNFKMHCYHIVVREFNSAHWSVWYLTAYGNPHWWMSNISNSKKVTKRHRGMYNIVPFHVVRQSHINVLTKWSYYWNSFSLYVYKIKALKANSIYSRYIYSQDINIIDYDCMKLSRTLIFT